MEVIRGQSISCDQLSLSLRKNFSCADLKVTDLKLVIAFCIRHLKVQSYRSLSGKLTYVHHIEYPDEALLPRCGIYNCRVTDQGCREQGNHLAWCSVLRVCHILKAQGWILVQYS